MRIRNGERHFTQFNRIGNWRYILIGRGETNINDRDWLGIETPKVKGERIKLKARLTARIDPRVVHAPHGWWFPEMPAPEYGCFDSNINVIVSADPPREEICGSVPTRGTLCRIYR